MVMALPVPDDEAGSAANTTEAVINGVDQASNSAPVGNGRPGVIDDQVNRAAREKRHLSMQQQQQEKALPPIRQRFAYNHLMLYHVIR